MSRKGDITYDYAVKMIEATGIQISLANNDWIQQIARMLNEYIDKKGTAWRRLAMDICSALRLKHDNPARATVTHLVAEFINKSLTTNTNKPTFKHTKID